uniref:Ig-like domain-containing protein n=1 Tax=Accipiter nisus TaxID=211598 RepID=A0A8B9RZL8_9AVES
MEVRWFRTQFFVYVHLYHSGQDHYSSQMPEYQGRTEFLKEGISVGNASLRILRTRLSDEGQYQCLIKDGDFYEEATLELNVAGKKHPGRWGCPTRWTSSMSSLPTTTQNPS